MNDPRNTKHRFVNIQRKLSTGRRRPVEKKLKENPKKSATLPPQEKGSKQLQKQVLEPGAGFHTKTSKNKQFETF